MKKLMAAIVAVATIAGVASAQTEVYSKNAVGYESKSLLSSGRFEFVRVDFRGIGNTTNTFENYMGSQLPANTAAYVWNVSSQKWDAAIKTSKSGWGSFSNTPVTLGMSVFLKSPPASPTNINFYMSGEVPDTAQVNLSVAGAGSLNAASYGYPVSKPWTNMALANILQANDALYLWNNTNNNWDTFIKTSKSGWGTLGNAIIIQPGQGMYAKKSSASSTNWSELKPYTWP